MRWTSGELAARLRAVLADLHLPGVDSPPNFGVIVGETDGAITTKHAMYRQNALALRTTSDGRLLRAIVRGLAAYMTAGRDVKIGAHNDESLAIIGHSYMSRGKRPNDTEEDELLDFDDIDGGIVLAGHIDVDAGRHVKLKADGHSATAQIGHHGCSRRRAANLHDSSDGRPDYHRRSS